MRELGCQAYTVRLFQNPALYQPEVLDRPPSQLSTSLGLRRYTESGRGHQGDSSYLHRRWDRWQASGSAVAGGPLVPRLAGPVGMTRRASPESQARRGSDSEPVASLT